MDTVWAYFNVPELTDTFLGMLPPRFHHSGRVIFRLWILERASNRAIAQEASLASVLSARLVRDDWHASAEHDSSDVRSR
jgi:hypothetical protein